MRHLDGSALRAVVLGLVGFSAAASFGQVQITEIMFDPTVQSGWEWVEVQNTTSSAVNLDGWVFDDDDDSSVALANISAGKGNTIVPANGAAVLYNGTDLNFDPSRFTNAWGSGITLVPVTGFTSLSAGDAIGLWNSQASYKADELMSSTSPRRTFNSAVASVNFATTNGFPPAASGHSIAWKGTGSVTTGSNWVQSANGGLGAHVSVQTTLPGTPINNVADRGTPGTVPGGGASTGLIISEIMYDPASAEGSWEYVELYNNTGAAINFASTPYVFDDDDDSQMALPNVTSGSIAQGGVGVLFNASGTGNTLANLQAAWGNTANFIPVTQWTDLSNSGDTVAVWSSFAAYNSETLASMSPRRTTTHAAAAVTYDNVAGNGWPTNNNAGSIFMANLTSNPATPASWSRSDSSNASTPQPVLGEVVDSPGGDVGSPGFVPGMVVTSLDGDYNGNGVVDMADYLLWRNALQNGTALAHDTTPGSVTTADYDVWRANFGRANAAGTAVSAGNVPEPVGWMSTAAALCGFVFVRRCRRLAQMF